MVAGPSGKPGERVQQSVVLVLGIEQGSVTSQGQSMMVINVQGMGKKSWLAR